MNNSSIVCHLQGQADVPCVRIGDRLVCALIVRIESGNGSRFNEVRVDFIEIQGRFELAGFDMVCGVVRESSTPYTHPGDHDPRLVEAYLHRLRVLYDTIIGTRPFQLTDFGFPVRQGKDVRG